MRFRFHIIDPKLRHNLRNHVLQCLLATLTLLVILWVEGAMAKPVVIAAIGSTAFVLFIMPHSQTASPRHVIGGHLLALAVGAVASVFDAEVALLFALRGGLAVGVSLFLMAATDTEHAPAAGTALGVVLHGFSWRLVIFLISSTWCWFLSIASSFRGSGTYTRTLVLPSVFSS